MYCKKCGRKLRNEARFCDHCGQSTKETRTQSTSKTTGARTQSSSKARSQYEKNKKQRQLERERVQKNRRTAFFLLLIAIVVAAVLGFASYNMTKTELDKEKQTTEETLKPENTENAIKADNEEVEEETEDEKTPKPTENSEKNQEKDEKYYETVAKSCNIYRDDRMDNIRCPYPESFEQGSKSNKNTVISLIDPLNDGAMMICAETVGTGKSASALMKDYAAGVGGSIKTSRAGDGWYEISFERNNKLNHRKAVIVDGLCVYYDFSYDVDSGEASSYEEYIEYIDYYLDKELTSSTKKQNSKEQ